MVGLRDLVVLRQEEIAVDVVAYLSRDIEEGCLRSGCVGCGRASGSTRGVDRGAIWRSLYGWSAFGMDSSLISGLSSAQPSEEGTITLNGNI